MREAAKPPVDYRAFWDNLPDDPGEILFRLVSSPDPAKCATALVEELRRRHKPAPPPPPCVICGKPVQPRVGRPKVCSWECRVERDRRQKLKYKLSRLVTVQGYPAALAYLAVGADADGGGK
jgi:predicted nucleic acid-binding Zn ribbon protein